MIPRRALPILAALLLPVLCACDATGGEVVAVPPPSAESLASLREGELGASRDSLARAIDGVFADDVGETRALLVMHDGKVIAERYATGYPAETRHIGWSLTKTVTGVVIGMLIADGSLALDKPAPVPRWQRAGDPRGQITLRELLQMRSGLRHVENGDPDYTGDTARMLILDGRGDTAHYAETQPLDADPGSNFDYSTASSVTLADIAARALTKSDDPQARHDAMLAYLEDRLFRPLGMTSPFPEFDGRGTFKGGSGLHATAADWARFGEMLRRGGRTRDGTQIVPRAWVRFMKTPSPGDPAFGAHLWVNRHRPEGRDPVLFPDTAPKSLFAMLGFRGQYVVISPDQKLTVVRLGVSTDDEQVRLREAIGGIVARFPRDQ